MTKQSRKKNIVLVGLRYDNNIGDQAIYYSTECLVKDILHQEDITDIEIRGMDMVGRTGMGVNPVKKDVESRQSSLYLHLVRFAKKLRILRKYANHYSLFKTRISGKEYEKVEQIARLNCQKYIDEDTAGIIFTGGGIIKYEKQMFHVYIRSIIQYAAERNIPVMISAAGIEGYSEKDERCIALKKALTLKNVRIITTRDDLSGLEKYCADSSQIIAQVADPACSLSVYLPQKRERSSVKTTGICLIRCEIFEDYGIHITERELFALWKELYRKITASGEKCVFFITGTIPDLATMNKFKEYLSADTEADDSVFLPRPMSTEDLAAIICSCDRIIASRLHASIFAYSYAVPCVSLVWNVKQRIFGRVIGCPERFIERKDFTAGHILKELETAAENGYDEQKRSIYTPTTREYLSRFIRSCVIGTE